MRLTKEREIMVFRPAAIFDNDRGTLASCLPSLALWMVEVGDVRRFGSVLVKQLVSCVAELCMDGVVFGQLVEAQVQVGGGRVEG